MLVLVLADCKRHSILVMHLTTAKVVMLTKHYWLITHLVIVNGLRVGHDVGSGVGCEKRKRNAQQ